MSKYELVAPESSQQLTSIVNGKLFNEIIKNRILPQGKFKTISAYIRHLILKDLDQTSKENNHAR
ncbi:MAG: hypothetical protein ACFFCI_00565 [Promethearchaeota archaeon]